MLAGRRVLRNGMCILFVCLSICAVHGTAPVGVIRPPRLTTLPRTTLGSSRAPVLRLRGGAQPTTNVSAQEAQAAYQTDLFAEEAELEFTEAVSALQREVGAGEILPDFGAKTADLVSAALQRFDSEVEAAGLRGTTAASDSRTALLKRLYRRLGGPVRQQLNALTKKAFSQFRREMAALKPVVVIDVQLKNLIADTKAAFDTEAQKLLPQGARGGPFSSEYEYVRRNLVPAMKEKADEYLKGLQVQGLFVSTAKKRMPIDVGFHWLLPKPFGVDARYSPIPPGSESVSKGKKMVLKSVKKKPKTKEGKMDDGSDMVFTDSMQ